MPSRAVARKVARNTTGIGMPVARFLPTAKLLIRWIKYSIPCGVELTGVRRLTLPGRIRDGAACCRIVNSEGSKLEDLSQFRGKSALRFMLALSSTARALGGRPMVVGSRPMIGASVGSLLRFDCAVGRTGNLDSALGGLCRVSPEDFVLERGTVKPANDRLHLVSRWRLDKRESFGFLRFVIPDYCNRVRDKVLGGQPLLDVVRSDPYG